METIALVGPYGADVPLLLEKKVAGRMNIVRVLTEADFTKLADVDYVILRGLKISADTIDAMRRIRLIQRWGVGFDSVDIKAAGARNVPVTVAPGANATPVSELAILLMLAVLRNLVKLHEGTSRGRWEKEKYIDNSFVIKGKVVGLIGCGAIGMQVARKVQAFGAEVVYYDIKRLVAEDEARMSLRYLDLEALLAEADIVSLHLPLIDSTRNLINERTIGLMKRNSVLINTARGEIVDSAALATALRTGRILGAGLDVFDTEPIASDNPLLGLDNVVLTPHTGGNTSDVSGDMVDICMDNIFAVSEGRPLSSRVLVNSQFMADQTRLPD